jgi:hypothetical protein
MNQRQQLCFFGVLFLGAMSLSDVASAQFAPDPFFYRKPEQIRPDLYGPNGSDPAPRFRSPNNSSSTPSSRRMTHREKECAAALNRRLQEENLKIDDSNFIARTEEIGKLMNSWAASAPECH